eukprot:scaffold1800_cov237-Pinguiococcus_pyrenoidosus.AAC.17
MEPQSAKSDGSLRLISEGNHENEQRPKVSTAQDRKSRNFFRIEGIKNRWNQVCDSLRTWYGLGTALSRARD